MSNVETFFYDVEKNQEQLNVGLGSLSQLYPAPESRVVTFYKVSPNPVPLQPPLKVPLARSVLPGQSIGPFLIILDRNPSGSGLEFSSLVVETSLEKFPANTYQVFNYSRRRLAVQLSETNFLVARGESRIVPYPNTRKAWLKVAAEESADDWLVVSGSPHPVGMNTRTTIFLVDMPTSEEGLVSKGIVVRRIRENIFTDEKGVQHVR
jgi:hypothetical protein